MPEPPNMLPTKYFISSILLGMIPSILGDETPMIVAGNQADPGEYPYYVSLNGCGGTLIAPDMVLTAAHCYSLIDDPSTDIYVGAYRPYNSDGLAQVRRCESFKIHPQYNSFTIDNDVALCKLNEPVSIDQSRARLELNEYNFVPSAGDYLTAIGLGSIDTYGTEDAAILQEIEVPYISQDVCASPSIYGEDDSPTLTENMLCAGIVSSNSGSSPGGVCWGDSGGPLVQIDGDVHTLMGVVSWGGRAPWSQCALVDQPGVFARVSRFVGWIKHNACNMGSSADFCDDTTILPTGAPTPSPIPPTDSPTPSPTFTPTPYPTGFAIQDDCGAGNGKLRFRATLETDIFPKENTISSYSFNQDYTALDKLIFRRDKNDLKKETKHYFPSEDEYYCLEKDRCYYFEVTDSHGDGISSNDNWDPVWRGFLGKQQKFASDGFFFQKVSNKIFCTGNACKDKKAFKNGKCKEYVKGSLNQMKRKCNRIYRGGDPVHKYCPETCGRKAGVGDCHWWKGMKKELKEAAKEALPQFSGDKDIARKNNGD